MTTFNPTAGAHGPSRCLATKMLGCDVTDMRAEAMGSIVEFMLDRRNRRVVYAVVSFGGRGNGVRKRVAVPWSRLQFSDCAAGTAVQASLDIAHAALVEAVGFDRDDWPEVADPSWAAPTLAANGVARALPAAHLGSDSVPFEPVAASEQAPTQQDLAQRLLTRLIGMTVVDRRYRLLAAVQDLVLDVRRATVDGLLLALDHDDVGADLVVLVPAEAVFLDADEGVVVLPSDPDRLLRMAKPMAALPPLNGSDWLLGSRELLETQSPRTTPDAQPTVRGRFLPEVPAANTGMGFGGLLDRVRGTILALESSSRQRKGLPRLHLRVRTDAGREVAALAAELGDPAQASLRLVVGQTVEMRGWWAIQGPHCLLILGSILVGGRTVCIDEGPRDQIAMP